MTLPSVARSHNSPELLGHLVAELLRGLARSERGGLHLLPVLVGPCDEHYLSSVQPHEASDGVAGQGGVGVPDVRLVVHVVDRSSNVKCFPGGG